MLHRADDSVSLSLNKRDVRLVVLALGVSISELQLVTCDHAQTSFNVKFNRNCPALLPLTKKSFDFLELANQSSQIELYTYTTP